MRQNKIIDKIINMREKQPSNKLVVFIRHGEKSPSDCGPALLTDQAKKDISDMAFALKALNLRVQLYSSPELRCVETAKIFNNIVTDSKNIILSQFLGDPGTHVKQLDGYLKLYMQKGARVMYEDWTRGQHYNFVKRPSELVKDLDLFVNGLDHEDDLVLLVSQSGTVAALEFALNLRQYDVKKNQWVGYLDGFVISYALSK